MAESHIELATLEVIDFENVIELTNYLKLVSSKFDTVVYYNIKPMEESFFWRLYLMTVPVNNSDVSKFIETTKLRKAFPQKIFDEPVIATDKVAKFRMQQQLIYQMREKRMHMKYLPIELMRMDTEDEITVRTMYSIYCSVCKHDKGCIHGIPYTDPNMTDEQILSIIENE